MDNLFGKSGALFSDDRRYRYALWRVWDEALPMVAFIGLNPSTANENTDGPTIRRVKIFASDNGCGGVYMLNLFAFITAYPKELKKCMDPVMDNDIHLKYFTDKCELVVFAWGNFDVFGRDQQVINMFPDACVLGVNKNKTPKHPLYIQANARLTKYEVYK